MPDTLFDKIWSAHEVVDGLLYIDLHLVHEVTSPQAFESLRLQGRKVRRPDRTLATADHNVPTDGATTAAQIKDQLSRKQVEALLGVQMRSPRAPEVHIPFTPKLAPGPFFELLGAHFETLAAIDPSDATFEALKKAATPPKGTFDDQTAGRVQYHALLALGQLGGKDKKLQPKIAPVP